MAMPIQKSAQHPSTRRYSVEEKAQAVRLVRQLRGASQYAQPNGCSEENET